MKYIASIILLAGLCGCMTPDAVPPERTKLVVDHPTDVETNVHPLIIQVASELAEHIAEQLPRNYIGTFIWTHRDGSGGASPDNFVTLHIDSVNASDDSVYFRGTHVYEPDRQVFDVVGQIDSTNHKVIMLESKRGEPIEYVGPNLVVVAITNGSFNGNISDDLSAIDAVWTTNGRTMSGVLAIKAKQ
jgi:hypothetical protein